MEMYEVNGTYGSNKTETVIYVAEKRNGGKWYVAEGSVNVNYTFDDIPEGVNIEELGDDDVFTAGKPINSLEDLEDAVNS